MRGLWVILSIIILFQGGIEQPSYHSNDLNTLVENTKQEDLLLEEWEVVFLENLDTTSFEEIKLSLQDNHFVKKDENADVRKYIFEPKNKENDVTYQLILVDPVHSQGNKQLQLVLSGTSWDEDVKKQFEYMTNKLQRLYKLLLNSNYTCIKLVDSDIMNDGFSVNNLLENMQLLHKQEQQDNIEESSYEQIVYGFSPLLSNNLEIGTEIDKINFQLTIRETTNNKKQVIIGTPVILNEY